jgi:hypothetical protein
MNNILLFHIYNTSIITLNQDTTTNTGIINVKKQNVIHAQLDSINECNAVWSSTPVLDLTTAAFTPTTKSIPSYNDFTVNSLYLGIKPEVLESDITYTFKLTCTSPSSGSSTVGSIDLKTNSPPSPGSFIVSPSSGIELSTSFTFIALNWEDQDLPITYQFGYVEYNNNNNDSFISLKPLAQKANIMSKLPMTEVCKVMIYDNLNALSTAMYSIDMTAKTSADRKLLLDPLLTATTTVSVYDNLDDKMEEISTLSSILNSENDLIIDETILVRKNLLKTMKSYSTREEITESE